MLTPQIEQTPPAFQGTEPRLVIAPPDGGPGAWAGAPTALYHDGAFYLSYRLRRPIGQGRGYANVVARSEDGVDFETVVSVHKEQFGAESLERPAITITADGLWRLYVSSATPGTSHWRVDLLESRTLEGLATATPRTVLPGSVELAVKDPVVVPYQGRWHLWASVHPLADPMQTDRMTTQYASSDDGVDWEWHGTALSGREGHWDARGVRISCVLLDAPTPTAFYDGRATAEENWEERTGVAHATGRFGVFLAHDEQPIAQSPEFGRGLRYLSVVPLPGGGQRLYYEVTRGDGAHELRTELVSDFGR